MLDQVGIPPFGFFEFGKFGLILFAAGMLYYWASVIACFLRTRAAKTIPSVPN